MKKTTTIAITILTAVFPALTGCGPSYDLAELGREYQTAHDQEPYETNSLNIAFLDVGQGDATIMITPQGKVVLIDAGPQGEGGKAVLSYLRELQINQIYAAFASHYHADHIGGFAEIMRGEDGVSGTDDDILFTGRVYDRGEDDLALSQPLYESYSYALDGLRSKVNASDLIEIDGLNFYILSDGTKTSEGDFIGDDSNSDENSKSIAMLISFGDFKLFSGGDLTGGGGSPPFQTPDVEKIIGPLAADIDVLKVSHHGSKTSTSEAFLSDTMPEIAVISVGSENDFSHPSAEVIERLENGGVQVFQTELGVAKPNDLNQPNAHVIVDVTVGRDENGEEFTNYEVSRREK